MNAKNKELRSWVVCNWKMIAVIVLRANGIKKKILYTLRMMKSST